MANLASVVATLSYRRLHGKQRVENLHAICARTIIRKKYFIVVFAIPDADRAYY